MVAEVRSAKVHVIPIIHQQRILSTIIKSITTLIKVDSHHRDHLQDKLKIKRDCNNSNNKSIANKKVSSSNNSHSIEGITELKSSLLNQRTNR